MIDRLQLGIQKLLTAKESELNAQMLALQAQVNPHFIHNTLSIIISLIEEGCNDKAKEVIIKLSQMIRYSSDYRDKQVSLKQEIHYIKDYMDLLKVRYEEDFSYKIIEKNNMENQIIPKYILQPLVENALQHSLKLSDYPWEIQISCYKTATSWYISIQDNGKRIEKEKVKELKAYVDQISTCDMKDLLSQLRIGGYSLINTIIRMYITYGESMIFDIFSNQQGGTTVVIGGGLKDDQGISG